LQIEENDTRAIDFSCGLDDRSFGESTVRGRSLASTLNVAQEKYIPNSSGAFKLFVYADGPSGSARYWNVTVAVAEGEHAKQNRVTEKGVKSQQNMITTPNVRC